MRKISIFGATGSIGANTLNHVRNNRSDFDVDVITGDKNLADLADFALEFRPNLVVLADASRLAAFKTILKDDSINVTAGRDELLNAAARPVDIVMSAVVGFAGFDISMIAASACQTLALANKESLVCGGQLLPDACAKAGCNLIPVDSEHSALFQCLNGEDLGAVERMILTASGGPFLQTSLADMANVTPQQAANHPNWSMGLRISIDSASMFNKAMEIIEAKELFNIDPDLIEVMVHPQSIIHSFVGYKDGNLLAQLGPPNMAGPIGYALNWPKRNDIKQSRLSATDLAKLTFQDVDHDRFPAINLAYKAMKIGNLSGAAFNGAKEQALDLFLDGQIGFLDIASLVDQALDHYRVSDWLTDVNLDNIRSADQKTREFVVQSAKKVMTNV